MVYKLNQEVRVKGTPFYCKVEEIHPQHNDTEVTAYSVRMPLQALHEGFEDVEVFTEDKLQNPKDETVTYEQFLEDTVGNTEYYAYLDHINTPKAEYY